MQGNNKGKRDLSALGDLLRKLADIELNQVIESVTDEVSVASGTSDRQVGYIALVREEFTKRPVLARILAETENDGKQDPITIRHTDKSGDSVPIGKMHALPMHALSAINARIAAEHAHLAAWVVTAGLEPVTRVVDFLRSVGSTNTGDKVRMSDVRKICAYIFADGLPDLLWSLGVIKCDPNPGDEHALGIKAMRSSNCGAYDHEDAREVLGIKLLDPYFHRKIDEAVERFGPLANIATCKFRTLVGAQALVAMSVLGVEMATPKDGEAKHIFDEDFPVEHGPAKRGNKNRNQN